MHVTDTSSAILVFAVSCVLSAIAQDAAAVNAFAVAEGAGVRTAGDNLFHLPPFGAGGVVTVTTRPGWRFKGGAKSTSFRVLPGTKRLPRHGIVSELGEDSGEINYEHCWFPVLEERDDHESAPVISVTPSGSGLALYAVPHTSVFVSAGVAMEVLSSGQHHVFVRYGPCPYCGRTRAPEEYYRAVIPDRFECVATGPGKVVNSTYWYGYLSAGLNQQISFAVSAFVSGCSECTVRKTANWYVDVGRVHIERPDYLGVDRTDAGWANSFWETATAVVNPNVGTGGSCSWARPTGFLQSFVDGDDYSVRYGVDTPSTGSGSYLAEELRATVYRYKGEDSAQAVCSTNFTIVKVDVVVDGVTETDEETQGAVLPYRPDASDGTLTRAGKDALVGVTINVTPSDLPVGEMVDVSYPAGYLYEKVGNDYVPASSSYRAREIGAKRFFLHGHQTTAAVGDAELSAVHTASGAKDKVALLCVNLDLDIDSDNDLQLESEDGFEDEIEASYPGKILAVDGHGINANTDYLAQLRLSFQGTAPGRAVWLSADEGGDKIAVYESQSKTGSVTLPHEFQFADLSQPKTLYVDGVGTGRVSIVASLVDGNGRTNAQDEVKMLVIPTISYSPGCASNAVVWAPLNSPNCTPDNCLGVGDAVEFENQIKEQGFSNVVWYEDTTSDRDCNVGSCTLANYKNIKNFGAVTIVSHGLQGEHPAVYFPHTSSGKNAADNWNVTGEMGIQSIELLDDNNNLINWAACVSASWIQSNWRSRLDSNRAIVDWAICYSASGLTPLKEAAGGRMRVGYIHPTHEAETWSVNEQLFGHMSGFIGGGMSRVDVEAALFARNTTTNVYIDVGPWTTLCPAPIFQNAVFPDQILPSQTKGWGCLILDTFLDDSVTADQAMTILSGSGVSDIRWLRQTSGEQPYGIGFRIDKQSGTINVRALHDKIRSFGNGGGRCMDSDRVAPNNTDKEWSF